MFNNCAEKQFRVCYLSNELSLAASLKVPQTNYFIGVSITFTHIEDYNTTKTLANFLFI